MKAHHHQAFNLHFMQYRSQQNQPCNNLQPALASRATSQLNTIPHSTFNTIQKLTRQEKQPVRPQHVTGRGQARKNPWAQRQSRETSCEDPSSRWRNFKPEEKFWLRNEFSHRTLSVRMRLFCASTVSKMKLELKANVWTADPVGILNLPIHNTIQCISRYKIGHISLHNQGQKQISQYKMYEMLAVMSFADLSGIILERAVNGLSKHGCNTVNLERICFIIKIHWPPLPLVV